MLLFKLLLFFIKRSAFDLFPTKVYLCSFHFLKMIGKRIDKHVKRRIKNHNKKLKKKEFEKECRLQKKYLKRRTFFLFCVKLLQFSSTMLDFTKHLRHTYIIFNSEYVNPAVLDSIKDIKSACLDREFNFNENQPMNLDVKVKEIYENYDLVFDVDNETLNRESPFRKHFDDQIIDFKETVDLLDSNDSDHVKNSLQSPAFFQAINHYLHIMPLWTATIISVLAPSFPGY